MPVPTCKHLFLCCLLCEGMCNFISFSAILTLKSSAGLFYLSCFKFFDSNFIFSERLSLLSSFLILILTHNPLPILIYWSILLCGTNLSTSVFPTVVKVLWEQKFCFDHIAIYPKITVSTQYTQKMSFHPNALCAIYSTVWIPSSHLGYSKPFPIIVILTLIF